MAWLPRLNAAGFDASIARAHLWLGASPVLEVKGSRIAYRTASGRHEVEARRPVVDQILRKIVLTKRRRSFELDVTAALREYPSLELRQDPVGARVYFRGAEVALVSPDAATVFETLTIEGNFLVPGRHWRTLAESCKHRGSQILLQQREARSTGGYRVLPAGTGIRVYESPATLPVELIEEVLAASRSIRLYRSTALGHRARLQGQECTVYFDPVRPAGAYLAAPFEYREDSAAEDEPGTIEGVLTIQGDSDPLPVAFNGSALSHLGTRAWAAIILAFRAISVPERVEHTPRRSNRHRQGDARRPSSHSQRSRHGVYWERLEPDYWSSSIMLERSPVGPHWVIGHKRILPVGHNASADKVAEAVSYGISLEPGETWVSPHARGANPAAVMPFYWDCPEALRIAILDGARKAA